MGQDMDEKPWFQEGLNFSCSQCGDCCTGAPGYVWVNKAEMEALAAQVGLDIAAFQKKNTRKVGIRYSLVELANGDCVFFDSKSRKCTVYDARPRQCRTWPFWRSNLRDRPAWAETCEVCPGSGQGNLVRVEEILEQMAQIRV